MKKMSQLALACALLATSGVWAKETKKAEAPPEWMKYTVPGEGHQILKDLAGNWKNTTKWWASATAKPEESKGTTSSKLILGGRFLQSDFKSTAMGQAFQGMGLMGYDAFKGEYQSVWIDSMSTAIMTSVGHYDPKTKVLSETGTGSDAMSGEKNKTFRNEYKFESKNAFTYSMYSKGADGKEFKTLEMTYKR